MRRIAIGTLAALVAALCAWLVVAPSSSAATGDPVHQVILDRTGTACESRDAEGNHSSVGTGIAFDGANLLASCWGDSTVTVNNPLTGALVSSSSIAGTTSLGALAYDAGRGLLYGCGGFTVVGVVDLVADSFTPLFDTATTSGGRGDGCLDGLAFDAGAPNNAADDTFWASHDVQSSVQQYSLDGTLIASNNVSGGGAVNLGFGNSGIATGGDFLYLANNGGSQVFEVAKDFSAGSLFAGFERRLEDLECDNITFANRGVAAMWVNDAFDNIVNAFEIPDGSCRFGGGDPDPVACAEDGLELLAPSGIASGTVHSAVEPLAAPLTEPLGLGTLVHDLNCQLVVPVEDIVDELIAGLSPGG